jgi:hypothetical protein
VLVKIVTELAGVRTIPVTEDPSDLGPEPLDMRQGRRDQEVGVLDGGYQSPSFVLAEMHALHIANG